jgi:hypothetical protein
LHVHEQRRGERWCGGNECEQRRGKVVQWKRALSLAGPGLVSLHVCKQRWGER